MALVSSLPTRALALADATAALRLKITAARWRMVREANIAALKLQAARSSSCIDGR